MIDPNLLDYCTTEPQTALVSAIIEDGSINGACRAIGMDSRNARRMLNRIKKNAAERHYSPDEQLNNPLPESHTSRGVSQLIDERTGKPMLTWYKSKPKAIQAQEIIAEALQEHNPKPFPEVPPPHTKPDSEYLDAYCFTDYHFGMLAWDKETGSDWDLAIAEAVMANALRDMIEKAKVRHNAETAVLALMGDLLHYDSLLPLTPSSGHVVDADSRAAKMVDVVLTVCEWCVSELLSNYNQVKVIVCEGNHDLFGSIWLRKHLKAIFRGNQRVIVDDSEFPFYAHLHGKTMIAFHHGHKVKNQSLPALFSSEPRYREMWGQATCCYIHTGHYHHREQSSSEGGGAIVERHQTLASADSHAVRGGYVSQRGANVITYHTEMGEVDRSTVRPREV